MSEALSRAISLCGSQAELARRVGVLPQQLHEWRTGDRPIPLDRVPAIESATEGQVLSEELRPDVQWSRDRQGMVTGYFIPVVQAGAA